MSLQKQMDPGKRFETELRAELEKENFFMPKTLLDLSPRVLTAVSVKSLGCDAQTYKSLVKKTLNDEEMNLFETSFLLNGFNLCSAHELGLNLESYANIIEVVQDIMDDWNLIVDPIKTRIANKIKTMMNINQPNGGRMVNPNLRKR